MPPVLYLFGISLAPDDASAFLSPVGGTFLIASLLPTGFEFSLVTSEPANVGRLVAALGASALPGLLITGEEK